MDNQRDVLLLIGAGILHCYTIRVAHAMGLYVICTDNNIHAAGVGLADEFFQIDVYDVESHRVFIRQIISRCHLVGVICAGGDSMPTVAACCEEARLPCISYDIAQTTWNKLAVRCALTKANLHKYQPPYCWRTGRELAHYGSCISSILQVLDFPIVVKPLSQRASRGVTIVDTEQNLHRAFIDALAYESCVLFEQQMVGSEHSAEILFAQDGSAQHFHIADRMFDYTNGVPIELGHVNPSRLSLGKQCQIKTMVLACAQALGVRMGSLKVDVMYALDGPKVLEVAARCSGGFDAQLSYPHSSGDNLLRRCIQVACGMPVTPQPPRSAERYCAVAAILPRKAGVVRALPALGGDVIWMIREGDEVQPPGHCAQRAGFVISEGQHYHKTWQAASQLASSYAEALEQETR